VFLTIDLLAIRLTYIFLGNISGSYGGEYEGDCLLGCCAAWAVRNSRPESP
jgi:hypothetical protein